MKTLVTVLSASALISTFAFAESVSSTAVQSAHQEMHQEMNQEQNEVKNRIRTMSTDELLEKRGTMTTQREREELHNELMNRQQTMTKEQKQKFNNRPENRTPKMKNQGDGGGMMQGQRNGMGSGMGGGGKGGR